MTYFSDDALDNIYDISNNAARFVDFEAPDIYVDTENTLYFIEHFEVDPSMCKKKCGSTFRNFEFNSEKKVQKVLNKQLSEGHTAHCTDQVDSKLRYEYLIDNIKRNFRKHYENIGEYKLNLRNVNNCKDVVSLFYIEDKSILPFYRQGGKGCQDCFPLLDTKVLEIFDDSGDLDGLIYDSKYRSDRVLWFIALSDNGLGQFKEKMAKHLFDSSEEEIISFEHPMTSHFAMIIAE